MSEAVEYFFESYFNQVDMGAIEDFVRWENCGEHLSYTL